MSVWRESKKLQGIKSCKTVTCNASSEIEILSSDELADFVNVKNGVAYPTKRIVITSIISGSASLLIPNVSGGYRTYSIINGLTGVNIDITDVILSKIYDVRDSWTYGNHITSIKIKNSSTVDSLSIEVLDLEG